METIHDHAQRMPSTLTDVANQRIVFHSELQRDRIVRRIDRKGNIEEYEHHQPTGKLAV